MCRGAFSSGVLAAAATDFRSEADRHGVADPVPRGLVGFGEDDRPPHPHPRLGPRRAACRRRLVERPHGALVRPQRVGAVSNSVTVAPRDCSCSSLNM